MVQAPTAHELFVTAARFAQSALVAHHRRDHQRIALDAGTALEHITKAYLAKRSPALLVELRPGPINWASLVLLCGHPEGRPKQLRTVGLREALARVKTFFPSPADSDDLTLLIDLRDGVVHAALDDEVEERLLVAFAQQCGATLTEMKGSRTLFWGDRLAVVDALLADASNKVAHRVQVKLTSAKIAFAERLDAMPKEVRNLLTIATPAYDEPEQACADCPACGCQGIAQGDYRVDDHYEPDEDGGYIGGAWVMFSPTSFRCYQCGLRLDTPAEIAAAGMPQEWQLVDVDVSDYLASDDDVDYSEYARAARARQRARRRAVQRLTWGKG